MKYKVLFTDSRIKLKVKELAKKITKDYKGKPIVLITVLNGAYIFASDLSKELWNAGHQSFEVDFVRISSYKTGKKSSGKPVFLKKIELELINKHVLIVEDIVETGLTLKLLVDEVKKSNPASLKICTLLSKPKRKVDIEPDYVGFHVNPEDWVEGYGLDTSSNGRGRPDIIKR